MKTHRFLLASVASVVLTGPASAQAPSLRPSPQPALTDRMVPVSPRPVPAPTVPGTPQGADASAPVAASAPEVPVPPTSLVLPTAAPAQGGFLPNAPPFAARTGVNPQAAGATQYAPAPYYVPQPAPYPPQYGPPGSYPLTPGYPLAGATSTPPPGYYPQPPPLQPMGPMPQQGYYPQPQGQFSSSPGVAQPPSPEALAFGYALQHTLPMPPNMIHEFKRDLGANRRAVEENIGGNPTAKSRAIDLTLKPGERAPSLRLYPGNATTVTFSDVTGAPWPVSSVTIGNPTAYAVTEAGEKGQTNMVVVSPLSRNSSANNMVVTLVGYPVPIIFTLETGASEVDYRLDVSVKVRGPKAMIDIVTGTSLPATNDPSVRAFLDGTPPKEARKVVTSSPRDVEAWKMNGMVYIRTPFEILSPAYVGKAHNVSGSNLYTMADASVITVSQDGRMVLVDIDR